MPRINKRLRIIAGPNGSGKSTFIDKLRQNYDCGVYINTDELEKGLRDKHYINLTDYHVEAVSENFEQFLNSDNSQSLIQKAKEEGIVISLSFKENILLSGEKTNSYEAALAGEFIKNCLLVSGELFTFETVMSHSSKLDFMRKAKELGYKIYVYFISTESVEINIRRVAQRVQKKGHNVEEGRIRSRFINTQKLLSQIIPLTHRTFLFDNSKEDDPLKIVAEIYTGKELKVETDDVPSWVYEYVLVPLGFI
jgi:predicted ABC-type ATPase